jgi:hypothetical protein
MRARVCERAVKWSLIIGRILLKCVGHVLQIAASSMGYVLFMFIHCRHACECASGYAFAYLWTDSLQIWKKQHAHHKFTTSYIGYILLMSTLGARRGVREC